MKLHQIVSAYRALDGIAENKSLTARESYGIMKLTRALTDDFNYAAKKQDELLKTYGSPDQDTPGKYKLRDPESYNREMREVLETEADVTFTPVTLRGDITGISPRDLAWLESFVTVEE